jgi:hypothetical protein
MKLAIYGDSFAAHQLHIKDNNGKILQEHLGRGWPEILEDYHEVNNFGSSGTAFMYSYELFLKNYKDYDLNIFIATSPQRTYVRALDGRLVFGIDFVDEEVERIKKAPFYNRKYIHLEILKSVRIYLELWQDIELLRYAQHAMVNNLWNLAPNTLVIPAFEDSIEQTCFNLNDLSRQELDNVENGLYRKLNYPVMKCLRKCHFSEENNKILAKYILSAIESNQKIFELGHAELAVPSKNFNFYMEDSEL